jgi:anthranilate 1,2-dioxygenase small subunit
MKELVAEVPEGVRRRIEEVIYGVARAIDGDKLEDMPGFFAVDGTYRVVTRLNDERGLPLAQINCSNRNMISDRIVSLRRANVFPRQVYRHLISGTRVERVGEERFQAVSNYLVVRTLDDGSAIVYSSGEYRDSFVISGKEALLTERLVVQDSHLIDTVLALPI